MIRNELTHDWNSPGSKPRKGLFDNGFPYLSLLTMGGKVYHLPVRPRWRSGSEKAASTLRNSGGDYAA